MTAPAIRAVLVQRYIVATSRHCSEGCGWAQAIGVGPYGKTIYRCLIGDTPEGLERERRGGPLRRTRACMDAEDLIDASPEPRP